MLLSQLISRAGLEAPHLSRDVQVSPQQVYAGDRISDLLNEATDAVLLVTNLHGTQLLQVAELVDSGVICLVNGRRPDEEMLARARRQGTSVLVSPVGLFETCGRLHARLTEHGRG